MADGQVKREVVIELRLAGADGNKATAAQVKAQAESISKAEVAAATKAGTEKQAIDAKVFKNRAALLARISRDEERATKQATSASERAAKERSAAEMKYARLTFTARMRTLADMERAEKRLAVVQQVAAQKYLAASKAAIGGIVDMARGVALLALSNEETTKRIVQMFLRVEAGVSVVRGLVTTWQSVAAAVRAANMAIAANAALSATAARAGTGAAAGGAAGGVAAAAGGGAVGRFAAGGLSRIGAASGPAAAIGIVALAVTEAIQGAFRLGGVNNSLTKSRTGQVGGAIGRTISDTFFPFDNNAPDKIAARRAGIAERDQRIMDNAQFMAGRRESAEALAARRDFGLSDADAARRAALRGTAAAQQGEAAVAAAQNRNKFLQSRGSPISHADTVAAAQQLLTAREQVASATEREFAAVQRVAQARAQAAQAAQEELTRARELVKAEEDRSQSALARFGRLSNGEQERARRIAAQGGPKNRSEAEFLESIGIGGKKAEGFFAGQGAAAGGQDVLAGLGELDALNQARKTEQESLAKVNQAQKDYGEQMQRQTDVAKRLTEALEKLERAANAAADAEAGAKGFVAPADGGGLPRQIGNMGRAAENAAAAVALRLQRTAQAFATQRV